METKSMFQKKNIKLAWDLIFKKIHPLLSGIVSKFQLLNSSNDENNTSIDKIWNIYKLCSDQIRKCIVILIDVLNYNRKNNTFEKESLQCILERLSCCHEKLLSIDLQVDKLFSTTDDSISEESIIVSTMYFVNWVDQTFGVLSNLSNHVYQKDFKSEDYFEAWKDELVVCVSGIHTFIDEMLLSAMTLCKYCLPMDQHIVKARCQVVLRETKALLGDLIRGNLDSVFQASKEALILPLNPSNVNVLIDVLKVVLYALETNTNTALLALVVHCFACNTSPVDVLKDHLINHHSDCSSEDCDFVREFDLFNERLMQIGSFAISCSSDESRVLQLRSGLASLEALDPHLVPAIMVAPLSYNANVLIDTWKLEVADVRDQVFLIVDPTAFAQKAKEMMHNILLQVIKDNIYNNIKICNVIDIGCVVEMFFEVYKKHEPNALPHQEKLIPLLQDLSKVIPECKVVNNILSTPDDFIYPIKYTKSETVSFDKLIKRLKLLYTIVNKICTLLSPEDDIFEETVKNETHTVARTFVNSPKKTINVTRSVLGRTTNIKSSTAKFPLKMLTKNLKVKKDLSFSIKLDELCDISAIKVRNTSIMYSPMKKTSLRKAMLSRRCKVQEAFDDDTEDGMDEAMSLQITEVLNEINNLTVTRPRIMNVTYDEKDISKTHMLKLPVNNESVTKHVWNITMRLGDRINMKRPRPCFLFTLIIFAFSSYFTEVIGLPTESSSNSWPSFPRRNVAALARDGYLKSVANSYKRSISTLAKNGMLPTFRAPYSDTDQQQQDDEEAHEKRNLASIARLRSYTTMKRNIQALARDGFRFGRGQYTQSNEKRNIAALARSGLIHKRDELGEEYYLPFYQNQIPPLSEVEGPYDYNEIYDYQQSVNPDRFSPVKRSDVSIVPTDNMNRLDDDANWYFKRGVVGMPVHGLYRPMFIDNGNNRNKRSIYSIPDVIDRNDINPDDYETEEDKRSVDDEALANFEKRHIGSLARLGWLPSFRYTGGRYSRSGRARFLIPSQAEREHSIDENFGTGQYLSDSEASSFVDPNNSDLPPSPISSHTHPTGRYLHRTLNDLPNEIPTGSKDPFNKNRWQHNKALPKFYYFRSLKVPYHSSGKRYLVLPAVDNLLMRKTYNNSLPSRRKNQ
ncbi:unnamed protein product [Leptosia nina]|uniref:Serendipity locus protein alpha n=1 Tax=Leptosia nina TaxID=320188 RepID=A0AAV1K223_9NEOP